MARVRGRAQAPAHAELPLALKNQLQIERFAPDGRETVKAFQRQVERRTYAEPVAAKLAAFMRLQKAEIGYLVRRAEELALALQAPPPGVRLMPFRYPLR